ncbi:hypothetical protein C2857_002373 [Epichloe festucae Fl1]|uniref:Uncharacterized protein n=1 Tax=Epichloe festucae (strain Fl1) TaxID=877507 RepID=A0A7S9PWI4_EPIFF|nr:hypothetical protein C2857_002373 [Epichloe festucae Fl1]
MASAAFAAPVGDSDMIRDHEAINDKEHDAKLLMPSRVLASVPDQVLSARDGCCSPSLNGPCLMRFVPTNTDSNHAAAPEGPDRPRGPYKKPRHKKPPQF